MKHYIENGTGALALVYTYEDFEEVMRGGDSTGAISTPTKALLDHSTIDSDGTIYFDDVEYTRKEYLEDGIVIIQFLDGLLKMPLVVLESHFTRKDKERLFEEIPETPSHVTIFTANGSTIRFENVEFINEDLEHSEFTDSDIMAFFYTSASDGLRKIAAFNMTKPDIIGYSIYTNKLSDETNGGEE